MPLSVKRQISTLFLSLTLSSPPLRLQQSLVHLMIAPKDTALYREKGGGESFNRASNRRPLSLVTAVGHAYIIALEDAVTYWGQRKGGNSLRVHLSNRLQ